MLSRVLAIYYFAYFLVILPALGLFEKTLPVPETISTPVLTGGAAMPSGAAASPEKKG
jgi:ubiquinol-cytochrome c reductase cytochrome b subunit